MAIMDIFRRKPDQQEAAGNAKPSEQGGVIGREALSKANQILKEYHAGKKNLDARIRASESWWKLRHWEEQEDAGAPVGNPDDERPRSAYLFNVIMGKHADAVEAYPAPRITPREKNDVEEARRLSAILPVVMKQNDFRKVWDMNNWTKNISGTAAYGVFWDPKKLNGLGDVSIRKVSILNLFWQPGLSDWQESPNLFHVEEVDREGLEAAYPQLRGKAKDAGMLTLTKYKTDDTVDKSKKVLVIDWYYKKRGVLHYCKYVGEVVLYASENDTQPEVDEAGNVIGPPMSERGWYDHGMYPFTSDALFPVEGSPCGYGYVDIGKSPQMSIDLLNQQIIKNVKMGATPRVMHSAGSRVNMEQFADYTQATVEVTGNVDEANIRFIQAPPLPSGAMQTRDQLIEELKYTSGSMDVVNGGATGGVTSASGIRALMQSAGRSSRAAILNSYGVYEEIILMVIELIRQFYTAPRQFRVVGADGQESFEEYSSLNIQPQDMGDAFGMHKGMRKPLFDVDVQPEKQTPFTRMEQNDLAIQMYQLGVFNPQMADQALTLLEMMDFTGKDALVQRVQQSYQNYQLMMLLQMNQAMPGGAMTAPGAPAHLPEANEYAEDAPSRKGREMASAGQPE